MNSGPVIRERETEPGCYDVCTGGGTHRVESATGACDCPDYVYRRAPVPGSLCRHGRALRDYLEKRRQCPACQGRGKLWPRVPYAGSREPGSGSRPFVCVLCDGTGQRAGCDADLLAGFEAHR